MRTTPWCSRQRNAMKDGNRPESGDDAGERRPKESLDVRLGPNDGEGQAGTRSPSGCIAIQPRYQGYKMEPQSSVADAVVNAAVLGRVLGISRATIANLATDGVLPRADRGLFNLAACVQAYIKHKLISAGAADVGVKSLISERSRLAKLKADAAEREALVEAGELVDVADIENAWLGVVAVARSRLLLIPTKVAARVITLKTAAEAQALLQKELNVALAGIATAPAI